MLLSLAFVVGGIALLSWAGGWFVDFATAIALRARLTPAVVGLTIMAAGTSIPEAVVSLTAAAGGSTDIAIANVVGSNIFNIALIGGLTALIASIPVSQHLLRLDYPFMLLASWICLLLARDGTLDRLECAFFLVSAILFFVYALRLARREVSAAESSQLQDLFPPHVAALERRALGLLMVGFAASLIGLVAGGRILVYGAVEIARAAGMSERLIGLTIVAAGTSLPELVTSVAAAIKRRHDMAMTNLVGSNIFNILVILGLCGTVRPIPIAAQILAVDIWAMMGTALLFAPMVIRDRRVSRIEGGVLLLAYAGYLTLLLAQA